MARTPMVFLSSDAPSYSHVAADAMGPVRRYRIPNFVFTLARDERLIARYALDAAPTLRRCRGGWWRSRLWGLRRPRAGTGEVASPILAVTAYRALLFEPAPESSPDPFHDSPYDVTEIAFETIERVRAVDGLLGVEGVLELTTHRGERVVVTHVVGADSAATLIRSVAAGYMREDHHVGQGAREPLAAAG